MPDFDDDEYESFDLEGTRDGTADADDSEAEFEDNDLDENDLADDEDDELEDAAPDEIDFVVAAYREDGQPMVQALQSQLANDLDELIVQLRRLPGDAGALGFVSLVEEVFVIVRVRGQHVQVLLNEEIPDPDEEETEPMGDLGILSDLGVSDFDMETIIDNLDLTSDQMLIEIADKIKIGPQFRKTADAVFRG